MALPGHVLTQVALAATVAVSAEATDAAAARNATPESFIMNK